MLVFWLCVSEFRTSNCPRKEQIEMLESQSWESDQATMFQEHDQGFSSMNFESAHGETIVLFRHLEILWMEEILHQLIR